MIDAHARHDNKGGSIKMPVVDKCLCPHLISDDDCQHTTVATHFTVLYMYVRHTESFAKMYWKRFLVLLHVTRLEHLQKSFTL